MECLVGRQRPATPQAGQYQSVAGGEECVVCGQPEDRKSGIKPCSCCRTAGSGTGRLSQAEPCQNAGQGRAGEKGPGSLRGDRAAISEDQGGRGSTKAAG